MTTVQPPATFPHATLKLEYNRHAYDEVAQAWAVPDSPRPAHLEVLAEGPGGVLKLALLLEPGAAAALLAGRPTTAALDPEGAHALYRPTEPFRERVFAHAVADLTPLGDRRMHIAIAGEAQDGDEVWRYRLAQPAELTAIDVYGPTEDAALTELDTLWPGWRETGGSDGGYDFGDPPFYMHGLRWLAPTAPAAPAPAPPIDFAAWPAPTDARPLVVEGVAHPVEDAVLSIAMRAGGPYPSGTTAPTLSLAIAIVVDERSGEDGALAPALNLWLRPGAIDLGALFAGTTFRAEDGTWEAFYGTDAPDLEDNVVSLSERRGDTCHLDWRAIYDVAGVSMPFRYAGRCRIAELVLLVDRE
jgi:hypothetical protein